MFCFVFLEMSNLCYHPSPLMFYFDSLHYILTQTLNLKILFKCVTQHVLVTLQVPQVKHKGRCFFCSQSSVKAVMLQNELGYRKRLMTLDLVLNKLSSLIIHFLWCLFEFMHLLNFPAYLLFISLFFKEGFLFMSLWFWWGCLVVLFLL